MFHSRGVRKTLQTAWDSDTRVSTPIYSPAGVLRLVAAERISSLFLVPTMFHDILREPGFARHDLGSLSRLGYAGMAMTPVLVEHCLERFRPDVFINHYGSSEIYTFTICDHLREKPGCAGRAGLNQVIPVVPAEPWRPHATETHPPPGSPAHVPPSSPPP